jgi:hypothetical protein
MYKKPAAAVKPISGIPAGTVYKRFRKFPPEKNRPAKTNNPAREKGPDSYSHLNSKASRKRRKG